MHDAVADALRQRILAALHFGALQDGDRLPSLRTASRQLRVDPRAVMAAYRTLAGEGLVSLRERSGVFVVAPAPERGAELPVVGEWVVDLFLRGLARGITPTELREQARSCLDRVRVRAACLECNDDQIHALRRQVQGDYGYDAVGLDLDGLGRRQPPPEEAANADLIVTTRFHAAAAERLGRRLRRPVLVATLDPDFLARVRALLAAGPVWWVCTDARFAAKLPRMFPGAAVTPVVLGSAPPPHAPEGVAVYATRRAAERLPADWNGGRVVTLPRVFSVETARALLAFLVERNLEDARGRTSPRSSAPRPTRTRGPGRRGRTATAAALPASR